MFIEHEMQSLFYSKLIYMMTKKALSSYLFIKTVVWESFIINPVNCFTSNWYNSYTASANYYSW